MVTKLPMAMLAACIGLAACQPADKAAGGAQGGDKYAGLDGAIRTWHGELKTSDAQCKDRAEGQTCRAFEVACKGDRPVTPEEVSKGMLAKVGVAMGWEAWDDARSEYRPTSATAEFQNHGGQWKRVATGPVNLSTCAAS